MSLAKSSIALWHGPFRLLPAILGVVGWYHGWTPAGANDGPIKNVVLAVHGGLGAARNEVTAEEERAIRAGLERAVRAGFDLLSRPDRNSVDAVEAAIRVLEDDPTFNAGRGAVFTHEAAHELDASIMEGAGRKAGAVAGVTNVKNPISAARAVMQKTRHVLLVGDGAERFAKSQGLELVDPKYFSTEHRKRQLERALEQQRQSERPGTEGQQQGQWVPAPRREWGTVGSVALDRQGNLAAGTSTGGMTNKMHGRVGDSPIIGAGTFAENATCAVSCTGHGEFFIRWSAASSIGAQMELRGLNVKQAVDEVIGKKLKNAGGEGAAIALDAKGNYASATNGDGLFRAWITADGQLGVALFAE
jgi:beta-aspartyl-peptidase (threonine type)